MLRKPSRVALHEIRKSGEYEQAREGMKPPDSVLRLVDRFDNGRAQFTGPTYNETQIRREFIDPFFSALGWDIDNMQGAAEAYKDVIHEDAIKVGSATKAPDYAFRIGGTRKFFVEAKKPAVNLREDVSPAFQLRRYAWSAKLPLSILTDFDELAVYDCRIKPSKIDKPSTARIKYLTYKDYVSNWEEIHSVFSRDAVWKGSFDKYVAGTKGKRGSDEVDDAFLKEIESWRDILARNLALRNPKLTVRELNFAVQRTIDRIIFLRICEDRGIETYGTLQALVNGERVYPRLCELFQRADAIYNSGLFHFAEEKGRPENNDGWTLDLSIDDKVLKGILGGLYYPDCPYEFSILPADILGQVYEQFLGKVIRLTAGHQAKVEEKPEVKKAGGVYYTPTYIVEYIVKNTVGKLVEGKTPKQVAGMRVLDPACGSGSFLIGAYQYLLDWHLEWYTKDSTERWSNGKKATIYAGPGGSWKLTTVERKRILLNNIYGVDIDSQAVEVTKLSLLLKVLEGENEQTINAQIKMFHERALPDLANNIKCGNSLIGPDFFEGKLLVDAEERMRINAFDWKSEFKEIMDGGGFDAVIGNPPYVRIQRIEHAEADYIFNHYDTASSKTDLATIFVDKALSLCSDRSRVGLICTSQWMSTEYGRGLRGLLSEGRIVELIDFGSLSVFEKANTYPAIFILSRTPSFKTFVLKKIRREDSLSLIGLEESVATTVVINSLNVDSWNLGAFDLESYLRSHRVPFKPLGEYGGALIGTLTGMDRAFVVTAEQATMKQLEAGVLLPYAYRGAEIRAYETIEPQSRIIYPYEEGPDGEARLLSEKALRTRFPNAYKFLVAFKEPLRQRQDTRKLYARGMDWYRYLRPGRFDYIRPPKLIIKGIDTRATVGFLLENTAFNGANCPGILLTSITDLSIEFFVGVLNSSLATYFLRQICPPKLSGYTRFNASSVNRMPIRLLDISDAKARESHDRMVQLVDARRVLSKDLAGAKADHERTTLHRQIDMTDKQIDTLVYELYGLTEEEIRIVEGDRA